MKKESKHYKLSSEGKLLNFFDEQYFIMGNFEMRKCAV
jgi:hypothetical protein